MMIGDINACVSSFRLGLIMLTACIMFNVHAFGMRAMEG